MGMVTVPIQLSDLFRQRTAEVDAIIDTGATNCVMPRDLLERLSITPEGQRNFELADGQIVEYPVGFAHIRLNGSHTVIEVAFGEEGVTPLVGVAVLEIMGLGVDPVHLELISVLPRR